VPLERAGDFPGSGLVPDRLVVMVYLALPVFTWCRVSEVLSLKPKGLSLRL